MNASERRERISYRLVDQQTRSETTTSVSLWSGSKEAEDENAQGMELQVLHPVRLSDVTLAGEVREHCRGAQK